MIDLHVHTKHSDGQLEVAQILQRAEEQKISIISFCDHNVLGAYEEISNMNISQFEVKIITGIELDFVHNNKVFHMLGYNFDWQQMNRSKIIDKKTDEEKMEKERKHLKFLKSICKKKNIKLIESKHLHTYFKQLKKKKKRKED